MAEKTIDKARKKYVLQNKISQNENINIGPDWAVITRAACQLELQSSNAAAPQRATPIKLEKAKQMLNIFVYMFLLRKSQKSRNRQK